MFPSLESTLPQPCCVPCQLQHQPGLTMPAACSCTIRLWTPKGYSSSDSFPSCILICLEPAFSLQLIKCSILVNSLAGLCASVSFRPCVDVGS